MEKDNNNKKSAAETDSFSDFQEINVHGDMFKQMFKFSVIPIIIHDLNMNILNVNEAAETLFGYSHEEFLRINIFELHTDEELEHSEKVLNEMEQKHKMSVETSFKRKDGSVFYAQATPCKFLLKDKPVIHVYIQDITERKQAAQALKESQERYLAIFNAAQIPIVITNREGYVLQFNKAAHDQTGYSAKEYAKINMAQIDVSRNNPDKTKNIVDEIREKGFVKFEAQHRHKNGDILDIIVYASAVNIKGEKYNLAVFNDITPLKRIQNELKEKNKELEQFNYITSHDLQEPLNTIIAFTGLLKNNKDKLDDTGKQSIEIIVKLAYRMKDFITSLLEYSRIGREKEKTKVDIVFLIENLKTDLVDLIEKKDAKINYKGKPLKIGAYEQDLIKLFQNIVVNGIKYSKNEIPPVIEINSEEHSDKYLFTISDNGIGIEEDQYEKIFEVFQRLHSRDKYSGTGIGLSYCKKVVELHHGDIWLKSKIGEGTTFYFTISKS